MCNNIVIFAPNILAMKIEALLMKEPWRRRLPPVRIGRKQAGVATSRPMQFDTGSYLELSQSDFLNELNPSSHLVNSVAYRSMRKKYKWDSSLQKNVESGYEDVARVSISLQEGTLRHKQTHTFGNEMWFGSESKDVGNDELLALYRSHWNMTGMTDALSIWGRALFATGDAALYCYREGERIRYKVFSFENGDVLSYGKNAEGKDQLVRMFMSNGIKSVEIYGPTHIQLWKKKDDSVIAPAGAQESEDGYVLISEVAHGAPRCPAMYDRIDDVVWGKGQSTIEHLEDLLSDLAENNKYFAYQILFLSGGVMSLPPASNMGKVIASKDKEGNAKILEPADASSTFTLDFNKNFDLYCECTGTVVIEPKELKAGENTGAFITNLYWREIQWSKNMIARLRPSLNTLIDIFVGYVGAIEEKSSEMKKLRMSFLLEPFVPKNITEEINNICNAVNSKVTSIETGAGEIPFNNPREKERLAAEVKEREARELAKKEPTDAVLPPPPGNRKDGLEASRDNRNKNN